MDDEKKTLGRPQTYTQESQFYAQELEMRRHLREEERQQEAAGKDHLSASSPERRERQRKEETTGRRREQENTQKIRILSVILGILVVILIAAMIYEIGLGHGLAETGSERMTRTEQVTVLPEEGV